MASDNITSLLTKINSIENSVDVFIPSLNKTVKSKPLNLKQQKDIISCVGDGVSGLVSFERILNNIVTDNTGLADLKVYDKLPVIVALRVSALGNTYKTPEGSIDITDAVKKLSKFKLKSKVEETFTYEGISVEVAIPTLEHDAEIIKKLELEIKKNSELNSKNISSIYTYELIKHIKSVSVGENTVLFNDLKVVEKNQVVDSIPLPLNKQLIKFIESYREELADLFTSNNTRLELGPGFFEVD